MKDKAINTTAKIPFFSSLVRSVIFWIITIFFLVILVIINQYNLRNRQDIESVDSLSGKRIGCCVGWESDFLLSARDDIILRRYTSNADCILALGYGQVDAISVDAITAASILQRTNGLELLPEPIARVGCTLYASYKAEPIMEEFNAFIRSFVETEEYREYKSRTLQEDGSAYHMAEVPKIENGKKLVVGVMGDSFPESFYSSDPEGPAGYGVEIIEWFAYFCGYTIEFVDASDISATMLLQQNKIDFAACYISDVSRKDTENSNTCLMTDAYLLTDVYLLKAAKGEKVELASAIDN